MSLESKIDALTAAVVALTEMLSKTTVSVHAAPAPVAAAQVVPVAAPVVPAVPAPVAAVEMPAAPAFVPPTPAPAMPAAPSFVAPVAPSPAAQAAPFSDVKGLVAYVMEKYQANPEKGPAIEGVMKGLGYENINLIAPEHFAAFYAGVEAL